MIRLVKLMESRSSNNANFLSTPDVSLLIPTFNSAYTIGSTILSCLQQTHQNIEVIVYDEMSKDGTRAIVKNMADADHRIRFFWSDTNSGAARAWLRLLNEAKGNYCSLVFSDDLLLPNFVKVLLNTLQHDENRVVTGCSAYCETAPAPSSSEADPVQAQPDRHGVYPFHATSHLSGAAYALGIVTGLFPVTPTCSLFKTDLAREVFKHCCQFTNPYGFDYERRAYGNDLALLVELGFRSSEVIQHKERLVVLRESPQSLTCHALKDHRFDFWLQYIWAAYAVWMRNRSLSPEIDRTFPIIEDRLMLIDTMASAVSKKCPKHFSLSGIIRGLHFLFRYDKRIRKNITPEKIKTYVKHIST